MVLTAAVCNSGEWDTEALVGAYMTGKAKKGAESFPIKKSFRHPDYDKANFEWDFRIVKLKKAVNLKDHPTCKMNSKANYPKTGANVVTVGIGKLGENGNYASILQKLSMKMLSFKDCRNEFAPNKEWIVRDSMICAKSSGKKNTGACNRDSGGPLFDSKQTIIGTISWGIGCAQGFP
jgi:trypsin